jgi:hypothetical protein
MKKSYMNRSMKIVLEERIVSFKIIYYYEIIN